MCFTGRDLETTPLTGTLEATRAGRASSLVLSGAGESAVLIDGAVKADEAQILSTAGLEAGSPSESEG
jgi:hypothetical protein